MWFAIIWSARSCHPKKSLDLDIYTLSSDSEAANLSNSCQKLARNIFTAFKNSLTCDSPYDLGESHNLYVWGSSAVNYRDARNIMNERHNGIVQEYWTNYFFVPKFICFIYSYFHMLENRANLTAQVNLFEGHLNGRVYEYYFQNCTQQQFHQLSLHHYPYTSDLNTGVTMQRLEAKEIMYIKVFESHGNGQETV